MIARIMKVEIILAIMRKPNSIIVLLYNYRCRSLSEVYEMTRKQLSV